MRVFVSRYCYRHPPTFKHFSRDDVLHLPTKTNADRVSRDHRKYTRTL